jgi:hypothetical protein
MKSRLVSIFIATAFCSGCGQSEVREIRDDGYSVIQYDPGSDRFRVCTRERQFTNERGRIVCTEWHKDEPGEDGNPN